MKLCGDNEECIFDALVAGNGVAEATLRTGEELEAFQESIGGMQAGVTPVFFIALLPLTNGSNISFVGSLQPNLNKQGSPRCWFQCRHRCTENRKRLILANTYYISTGHGYACDVSMTTTLWR